MGSTGRYIGFVLILTIACHRMVCADRIVLSNGDQITGKVLSYEKKVLQFQSALLGNLNVKTDDIKTLEMDSSISIVMQDRRNDLQHGRLKAAPGELRLEGDTGARQVLWDAIVALGSAAEKLRAPAGKKFKWSGNASAGFSGYTGNVNFTMLNSNAVVKAINSDWAFNAYFNNYYAERQADGENIRIGNLLHGGVEVRRLLSDRYSLFAANDEDKNEFSNLSFRNIFTSGVIRKWTDSDKFSVETKTGAGHEYELFSDEQKRSYGVGNLGSDVNYKITDRVDLTQRTSWLPRVDDDKDYRIVAESSATVYFDQDRKWFVKAGLKHEYDNQPAVNLDRMDMYYFTNVGLNF